MDFLDGAIMLNALKCWCCVGGPSLCPWWFNGSWCPMSSFYVGSTRSYVKVRPTREHKFSRWTLGIQLLRFSNCLNTSFTCERGFIYLYIFHWYITDIIILFVLLFTYLLYLYFLRIVVWRPTDSEHRSHTISSMHGWMFGLLVGILRMCLAYSYKLEWDLLNIMNVLISLFIICLNINTTPNAQADQNTDL